jgi:hypothetical protein
MLENNTPPVLPASPITDFIRTLAPEVEGDKMPVAIARVRRHSSHPEKLGGEDYRPSRAEKSRSFFLVRALNAQKTASPKRTGRLVGSDAESDLST